MKPIAILQHVANDGPGYFTEYLQRHGLAWQVIAPFRGDAFPARIEDYAGYCILGGPMSANDPLPWMDQAHDWVRQAIARDIPVIGHCLGGQIMARALGATVRRAPCCEIGWVAIESAPEAAGDWFGGEERFLQFQWHGDTFAIPPEGRRIARSDHCGHQAFSIGEKHLAMQFHTEITREKIEDWLVEGADEIIANAHSPAVQSAETIRAQAETGLNATRQMADRIYGRWVRGLVQE
ncbi:MAG: type 1 glutamine amidotransferase [Zoogloea sp.]|uniref:type 1 glutamine amidotransferase n=1 Tax=Zoogloea sp. TaxID=49181 RepID=UPI003F2D5CE1